MRPSIFGRPKPDEHSTKVVENHQSAIEKQHVEANATLKKVREVLEKRDQLLAEAVNQTGNAVRRKRRVSRRSM